MPLTPKGTKVMNSMKKTYGAKNAKQVFYAMINEKKLIGVEAMKTKSKKKSTASKIKKVTAVKKLKKPKRGY